MNSNTKLYAFVAQIPSSTWRILAYQYHSNWPTIANYAMSLGLTGDEITPEILRAIATALPPNERTVTL